MTLAQLKVFVLVSRLGSVRAAAAALGVSEPAVSQALAALRQHLDDPLISRSGAGMELTPAGRRVVSIASQMVNLAVDAEAAVRQSNGAAELLRVVTSSTLAQSIVPSLLQAFTARAGGLEVSLGVATTEEMSALVEKRLADIAIGPRLPGVDAEPVMRYRLTLVGHPDLRVNGGGLAGLRWLVDPTGADPLSDVGVLLKKHRVPESHIMVFANERPHGRRRPREVVWPRPSITWSQAKSIGVRWLGSLPQNSPLTCCSTSVPWNRRVDHRRPTSCAASPAPPTPCKRCTAPMAGCPRRSFGPQFMSRSGVKRPLSE